MINIGWALLFIMFNQVLAKERAQAGDITGDDMPESVYGDYGRLYTVELEWYYMSILVM